jgi:ATP-dependent Zn protease
MLCTKCKKNIEKYNHTRICVKCKVGKHKKQIVSKSQSDIKINCPTDDERIYLIKRGNKPKLSNNYNVANKNLKTILTGNRKNANFVTSCCSILLLLLKISVLIVVFSLFMFWLPVKLIQGDFTRMLI